MVIEKENTSFGEKHARLKIVVKGLECQHVEKGKCVECAFGFRSSIVVNEKVNRSNKQIFGD